MGDIGIITKVIGERNKTKQSFMKEIKFDGEKFTIIDGGTKIIYKEGMEFEMSGRYSINAESIAALLSAFNENTHAVSITFKNGLTYDKEYKTYVYGYPVGENKRMLEEISLLKRDSDSLSTLEREIREHNKLPFYKRIKRIEL